MASSPRAAVLGRPRYGKVISVVGHLLVASVCLMAGYALAPGEVLDSPEQLLAIYGFLVPFLLGAYINRVYLYEYNYDVAAAAHKKSQGNVTTNQSIAVLAFLLLTLFAAALAVLFATQGIVSWQAVRTVALGAVPLSAIVVWRSSIWPNARVYYFMPRTFCPAMASCVMSFVTGWSLQTNNLQPVATGLGVLVVLTLPTIAISETRRVFGFLVVVVGVLAAAFIVAVLPVGRLHGVFGPCVFGVLLALAMGVAESFRVTTRVRDESGYVPHEGEPAKDVVVRYHAHTNIALATAFPASCLLYLSPAVGWPYLVVALVTLPLASFHWYKGNSLSHAHWWLSGVVYGLLLPVALTLDALFAPSLAADVLSQTTVDGAGIGGVIGVLFGVASLVVATRLHVTLQHLFSADGRASFVVAEQSLRLTFVNLLAWGTGVFVAAQVPGNPLIESRVNVLLWVYTIGAAALGFGLTFVVLRRSAREATRALGRENSSREGES